jgi:hypothetical protein
MEDVMERALLGVMCSGLLLLVTAFALATPGIKSAHPPAEQAMLVRLLQHPASSR